MASILVTGAAGFIGFHLSKRLLELGHAVVGIDNLNDYYSVKLKEDRLALLVDPNFSFEKISLENNDEVQAIGEKYSFDIILNLAAQAGVRYSLLNPAAYVQSNLVGFANLLELCRSIKVKHFIYASTSSVYGLNSKSPFSTEDNVDHPASFYAATKKANELMAHSYSHLYNIPTTGLRFFTVYGPWGRPDMALFKFTKAILEGKSIDVFNNGNLQRDFTYIDDIVDGIVSLLDHIPASASSDNAAKLGALSPAKSSAPYRIYNIGNNNPVKLEEFITTLEKALGKKAIKNYLPMQPGDLLKTCADISDLQLETGFAPIVSLQKGVEKFVAWYKDYYKAN